MTTQTVIAVALLVPASSTAFADPITMTASRRVTAFVSFEDSEGFSANDSEGADSATLGRFQVSREAFAETALAAMSASASQDTNIDPLRHRVVGSGSGILPGPSNDAFIDVNLAESELDLDFTLARPTPFRMQGTLSSTSDDRGFAQAVLDDVITEGAGSSTTKFDHRGILQSGHHFFFALATVGDDVGGTRVGQSSFDIDFSLGSPTPEPASLALLATGLVAAVASRRRTRQGRSVMP